MRENQSISKQAKVILGLFVFLGLLTMPVEYAAEIADTIPAPKAEISDAELAQKILNPVAAMVSVPFIFLGDYGIGPDDGNRVTLSMQPVIPFELNEKWNLITRTLIPVLYYTTSRRGLQLLDLVTFWQPPIYHPSSQHTAGSPDLGEAY